SRMLHRPLPLELRTRAQLILATAYLRQGRPEAAKPVLEEAIDVAERSSWPHLLVDLYDRLGSVYYLLRHAHAAGQWFEKAIERYQSAGLKDPGLKARVLGHRANLHYVAGQPTEAIAAYESGIASSSRTWWSAWPSPLSNSRTWNVPRISSNRRSTWLVARAIRWRRSRSIG